MTIAQQLKIKTFPFIINDDKGEQIYYENSSGYWSRSEYDDKGTVSYMENSNGFWAKWEHDDSGNEIYFENSKGHIVDLRPKVVEIEGIKYKLVKL